MEYATHHLMVSSKKYSTNGGSTFTTYYYMLNLQGDVVKLLNRSGQAVRSYQYDSWGRVLSIRNQSGAEASASDIVSINPIRYRGYYYDQESGLYYLNSRYYDPIISRFVNADDAEYTALSEDDLTETKLFCYVANNPVMKVDPDGTLSNGWKIAITGTILAASVAVIIATGGVASGTGHVCCYQCIRRGHNRCCNRSRIRSGSICSDQCRQA